MVRPSVTSRSPEIHTKSSPCNRNTVFCNYLGHGHLGQQPQVFEITPAKAVVWEFRDETHIQTINQIQLLDLPGDVTRGEILR